MEFLRQHQLSIMLFLSGTCTVLAILSFFTSSMPKKRRRALTLLEVYAALLLFMDRFAYMFRGDPSTLGWWIVRISNFSVYLFSICILHAFTLYLCDLFTTAAAASSCAGRLSPASARGACAGTPRCGRRWPRRGRCARWRNPRSRWCRFSSKWSAKASPST